MWLIALMQISDAMNANSAGCLRGQGQTKIGGIVNLFSYYVVGLPLSVYLSFYSPWKGSLHGLWIGSTVALTIIGSVQSYYALTVDFNKLCDDARKEPILKIITIMYTQQRFYFWVYFCLSSKMNQKVYIYIYIFNRQYYL